MKTENARFRTENQISTLMGPKRIFFQAHFVRVSFSGRPPPENGTPFSDNISVRNWRLDLHRHRFRQIVGGNKRCDMQETAANEHKTASICQATRVPAACCAPLPTRARLRPLHEPMGSDCDGVDHESLASVLAVAIAAFTKLNHNLSPRGKGQSVSGRI